VPAAWCGMPTTKWSSAAKCSTPAIRYILQVAR
jgi:hypothetical protein